MNPYVKLAKQSIAGYLKNKETPEIPKNLPAPILEERAGVFVSLKKDGDLRGCIGTFLPTKKNVAKEIIDNAVAAAIDDPRFPALTEEELDQIDVSVDVLSEPERVNDLSELDPQIYGVYVKNEANTKSGLLLPDLEEVETPEQQVAIACQKAGIDLKKEKIIIYKFTVKRHHADS